MENNQIVPSNTGLQVEGEFGFIADLTATRKMSYSSLDITKATQEVKAKYFNAINSASLRLAEQANLTLNIQHVFVEVVQCTNEETGETKECPRTVLIDDKGVGYQAVSLGVFSSLKKVFEIFGMPPTWKKPLPLKVKVVTKGLKNITTLEVAL